jgi:hypothetical protein
MMTNTVFDMMVQSALPAVDFYFGKSVIFRTAAGVEKTVKGVFRLDEIIEQQYGDSKQDVRTATLQVNRADCPAIDLDDSFIIDSTQWAIVQFNEQGPMWNIQLETRTVEKINSEKERIRR